MKESLAYIITDCSQGFPALTPWTLDSILAYNLRLNGKGGSAITKNIETREQQSPPQAKHLKENIVSLGAVYYHKPFLLVIIEYRCRSFFPQIIPGYLLYSRHAMVDIYIGLKSSLTRALFLISNFSDHPSLRFSINWGVYLPPSTRTLLCTHQHRPQVSLKLSKQRTDFIFSPTNLQVKIYISRNYDDSK